MQVIYNFLLFLDGVVYSLVDYVYDIFDFLAKLNIFDSEQYGEITGKIYIILGLIMMFVLSYSLLRAVMNPDDFAKGEKSFPNLIKNIIISLALIVVMPAIFEFATDFQMAILDNNTIPKFILGDSAEVDYEGTATADESVTNDAGRMMSYYVFRSFFYPNPDWCSEKNHGYTSAYGTGDDGSCTEKIKGNGWWGLTNGDAFYEVDQNVLNGEASFFAYSDYGESTADGRLTYYMLITTIAGGFLVYVLASFCFDMAIRVIKLAFYELIAPIPIICRILPGGNMKDVFSKWVKQIISVYIEVFIRVAIMYLGVYLIKIVVDAIGTTSLAVNGLSWHKQAIVVGLLIIGVIIFIKQAPKLIGDMFHLDTGGMKLGIMDKLAMGGILAGGAFVGGGLTTGARNLTSGFSATRANMKKANGGFGKFKALAGGVAGTAASTLAGAASGAVRSGKSGLKAKNIKDAVGATNSGITAALLAKQQRANKRDSRQAAVEDFELKHNVNVPKYVAGVAGVGLGAVAGLKQWATGGADQYSKAIESAMALKKGNDAVLNEAEKLVDKNINDSGIIQNVSAEKTFKNNQKLMDVYNNMKGQSLGAWQKEIQGRSSFTDFASLVDKNKFEKTDLLTAQKVFDSAGYQDAISKVQREYYQATADMENAYNMLRKQVITDVANAAMNDLESFGSIGSDKWGDIKARSDELRVEISKQGETLGAEYSRGDGTYDYAKAFDDIATKHMTEANKLAGSAARHKNLGGKDK